VKLPVAAAILLSACAQEIVVLHCDAVTVDAAPASADAVANLDTGGSGDAMDAGVLDAGHDPCRGLPYCLRAGTATPAVANVNERVSLRATVEGRSAGLVYSAELLSIARRGGRPAAVRAELGIELQGTPSGASFRVVSVPPWFSESRFLLRLTARGPGSADPPSSTEVEVTIRGNLLMSGGSGGGGVYAMASDGLPATGGGHPDGKLLEQLVRTPRAMRVLADGSLLVADWETKRLLRFEMSGKDVLLGEWARLDGAGAPTIRDGSDIQYGLAVLADGRVALTDYQFAGVSGEPKSHLLLWKADGSFDRRVLAGGPNPRWRAAVEGPMGSVLVADEAGRAVTRLAPPNFEEAGNLADTLPEAATAIGSNGAGDVYVGGVGYLFHLAPGGGRAAVAGLPARTVVYRAIVPYADGGAAVATDTQSRSGNVYLIRGRNFERELRSTNGSGAVINIWGLAYLD